MKRCYLYYILICLSSAQTQALCILNKSNDQLSYIIENKDWGCSRPKVLYYEGELAPGERKCFAHDRQNEDWKLYRHDLIRIEKIENRGQNTLACEKKVEGILNTLEINYLEIAYPKWRCLDDHDSED